jgi:hypothetical protein
MPVSNERNTGSTGVPVDPINPSSRRCGHSADLTRSADGQVQRQCAAPICRTADEPSSDEWLLVAQPTSLTTATPWASSAPHLLRGTVFGSDAHELGRIPKRVNDPALTRP